MEAIFKMKHIYGIERIYPVNYTAATFMQLTGRMTATANDLKLIEDLGYKVIIL
jgi:hypothetical protein